MPLYRRGLRRPIRSALIRQQLIARQAQAAGCPGQIKCADGRCVESVTDCDLSYVADAPPEAAEIEEIVITAQARQPYPRSVERR